MDPTSKYNPAQCRDFQEEKNALADLVESRGHILLLGVKCHPEMAGCGVEYVFGYSKRHFRKHNNCKVRDLEKNVRESLSSEVITLPRLWKFERRAWLYQQMYLDIARSGNESDSNLSYEVLEKTMKDKKATHRNILEIENKFLRQLESSAEMVINEEILT
jgi:hypothetical protein